MDTGLVLPDMARLVIARAEVTAPGYKVSGYAPDDYTRLLAQTASDGVLTVWNGASDATIYGSAQANWAFRAWHDTWHIRLAADFTIEGERKVALAQASECDTAEQAALIMADVLGQAEYFEYHKAFPADQVGFVLEYVRDKESAVRNSEFL